MKSTTKKWAAGILAAVIGLGAFGATAIAKNRHGGHGERMVERISERLSLDEGQQASLQALQLEVQEMREAMANNGETTRTQIGALISAESFDQDSALQMINNRVTAVQNNAPDLVAAAAVFFDGLSAEQKTQVEEFMTKMSKRHRHGKDRKADQ
ncbi:MAG: periplasmic heavy metal sensor [Gammaproteobacteria bacterium]|nr:periplasmic heavy metal sensor [Gammaproteobacteria bacterium]